MSGYQPVPLPSGAAGVRRDDLVAGLTGWVRSRPLRDLVAAFGDELPDRMGAGELLAWLDDFSARHWDFRRRHGAVERDEVVESGLDPAVADLVRSAAEALGLTGPRPVPERRYDHLLVLGGLARSCLQRTGYAALLVGSGAVEVGEVSALGSFRPLRPLELDRLPVPPDDHHRQLDGGLEPLPVPTDDHYRQLDGGYEVDAMDVGVRVGFGCPAPVEERRSAGDVTHRSWSVAVYRPAVGPVLRVLAAPSTEPETRRAHTSDTYHFWAAEVGPAAGDRVLVLTSQLYVPFQHCDAIRTLGLGYGCEVDTIGLDPSRLTGYGPAEPVGADRYLQEIRSAVRSIRNLFCVLG
ncbi:hypothetical protein [Plantactinospora endophytica]|uniref:Nitroreductase domain-containing protein n=1 Tax=Plantactinospora endophytica TaxID=673535 RepID=A0ABQ4DRI2_9ACTN|nr:hypothetical protein [Plantactinospora endophytica]GIG85068.1 hypothetical protein Pen02_00040 [Plantactinospora endophytica]